MGKMGEKMGNKWLYFRYFLVNLKKFFRPNFLWSTSAEAYSELSRISKMELFAKQLNGSDIHRELRTLVQYVLIIQCDSNFEYAVNILWLSDILYCVLVSVVEVIINSKPFCDDFFGHKSFIIDIFHQNSKYTTDRS